MTTSTSSLRHFLEVDDVSPQELTAILDASEAVQPPVLAGKGVALIFEKPSLRTRNSSEMAVVQLGGHPVFITDAEAGLDKRESAPDVLRTLQGYHSVVAARVFQHNKLTRMVEVARVPIINLLSDEAHPVQALADLLTIRQEFGSLQGLKLVWLGDFTNVARSLTIGALMFGAHMVSSGPHGYGPTPQDFEKFASLADAHGGSFTHVIDPATAVAGADVVNTDAWYSMGQEAEAEARRPIMEPYRVDAALLALAKQTAIFLHCLPAHRGDEATSDVLDGPQSRIWVQAHNRMHTMRGLLAWLCG
jgi:ornithine carbamoyltransferase